MIKLFRKSTQHTKNTLSGLAREYYIGSGVFITGQLASENDIYLDGSFKGEVTSAGLVEIDVNAKLSGVCRARTIQVRGRFEGDLIAQENITISSSAHIIGSIAARAIETQPGAIIDAQISVGVS